MSQVIDEMMDEVQTKGRAITLLMNELREFEDTFDSSEASTEDRTQVAAFREIVETLAEPESIINYYNKRVKFEGYAVLQESGHYIAGEKELSSGSIIEVLDDVWGDGKTYQWKRTHIEYDKGYYAVGFEKSKIDELRVRIR
jgi:hypothetical protein